VIPALILARGGSKGVPGKNKAAISGVPLVVRTVREAQASRFEPVYVWSDDRETQGLAKRAGAVAPHRPAELSRDDTTSEACVSAFLKANDTDARYEAVALLQCTTPFLRREHLEAVYDKWMHGDHDSVLTATEVTQRYFGYPNRQLYVPKSAEFVPLRPYRALRQQEAMRLWMENGGCYLAHRDLWHAGRRIGQRCGVVLMGWWESLEIDDPIDMDVATALWPLLGSREPVAGNCQPKPPTEAVTMRFVRHDGE
jgi:CMP-N-acetylneuraminic acid synthetase